MIKITLMTMVALFTGNLVFAQMSAVSGRLDRESKGGEISLFGIGDGADKLISTTVIAGDGSYGFLFAPPYEGFYMIGAADNRFPAVPVYLKPGDDAKVDFLISQRRAEVNFDKDNTPENTVLGQWLKMSETTRVKSLLFMGAGSMSDYEDFFPDFIGLLGRREAFLKAIDTPNARFNQIMTEFVDFNTEYIALNFICVPRTKHPDQSRKLAFYEEMIVKGRFADNNVLQIPWGARYLKMYVDNALRFGPEGESAESYMMTDELRGAYYLPRIVNLRSYDSFLETMDLYGRYFVTPEMKKAVEETGARLYDTKPGVQAANFTYPDAEGKKVSLTDFRGKVVLVDVWATWCGPCKAQIPALKELERQMHGRDIVFVSVSVDEDKDFETWKQMIADEELGGVQLFGSGWSQIAKDYKITGIPRFMLFDREGRIITVDAPRPSQPELKTLIEKYL